ncbi:MAG: Crp/Fnr family transcriptional regulator [Comamonadaceae bacterium]|nr:MAG: Crp/Fnr family transcriptional regulator [Comamonadaceae bacterium]
MSRLRDEPLLTEAERAGLQGNPWFAALPMLVRHDILCHCTVQRHRAQEAVHAQGESSVRLDAVASGAVGIGLRRPAMPALEYLPAGTWFVDPSMFGGRERLHAAAVHGRTTVVSVRGEALTALVRKHRCLEPALLQLNHERVAAQFEVLEELTSLPLEARLARCIRRLCDRFGKPEAGAIRIALPLKQDALADMIRVSRQRVNLQLKRLEGAGIIEVSRQLLVVQPQALAQL